MNNTNIPSPIKILIVEDDDADYKLMRNLTAGFRSPPPSVTRASSTHEAMSELAHGSFDVLILDVNLRGESSSPLSVIMSLVLPPSSLSPMATILMSGVSTYDLVSLVLSSEVDGALTKNHKQKMTSSELESYVIQAIVRRKRNVDREIHLARISERVVSLENKLSRYEGKAEGRGELMVVTKSHFAFTLALLAAITGLVTALSAF